MTGLPRRGVDVGPPCRSFAHGAFLRVKGGVDEDNEHGA